MRARYHGIWDHLPCTSLELEHHKVEFSLLDGAIGSTGGHRLGTAITINSLMGEGATRLCLDQGGGLAGRVARLLRVSSVENRRKRGGGLG
jgi:hypothetical protein